MGGFQLNELLFGKAATGIGRSEIYSRGFQSRFFIENVFEELDAPSEWYLDGNQGILYYIPEAGEDLKTAPVEAPVLERIIELRGSQRQPVQFVNFSGFRVAHTARPFSVSMKLLLWATGPSIAAGPFFWKVRKTAASKRCSSTRWEAMRYSSVTSTVGR
jgi:hypothetical protein